MRRRTASITFKQKIINGAVVSLLLLGAAGNLSGSSPPEVPGQAPSAYEEAIAQADRLFQGGNYRNAVERYFFASQVAKERLEYARAYLGLAMSYFFLKDTAAAEKWSRMVLEVSPRVEVAVPAYPISFVQFFDRVRNDFFKGAPPPPDPGAVPKKESPAARADSPPASLQQETAQDTPPPIQKKPATTIPAQAPVTVAPPAVVRKGGHLKVMFHLSGWTIDPVIKIVEGLVTEKVGDEILDEISLDVRSRHFTLVEASTQKELTLSSGGTNYGLEIRYFSRGWPGSFSLGLAFEMTSLRLALQGKVKQTFTNGTSAEAEANGTLTLGLSSTVFSFRWDVSPAARLSPYVIFGLGITPFQGKVKYEYVGTYSAFIYQESITGGDEMTLKELAEENDYELIDVFVILQLAIGLELKIYRGLTFVAEGGIWDGFYYRGGLGYRF